MKQDRDDNKQERPLPLDYKIVKKWVKDMHRSAGGNPSLAEMLAYLYWQARVTDSYLENDLFTIAKEVFNRNEPSWDAFEKYAKRTFKKYAEFSVTRNDATQATTKPEANEPPVISLLADLFNMGHEVLKRGDKQELEAFRLALNAMRSELPENKDPREIRNEQFADELNEYGNRDYVRPYLEAVLWAAQRSDSVEKFERQILADALALAISSPHTPADMLEQIKQTILDVEGKTDALEPLDTDNLREWFPTALQRLKEQEQEQPE